MSVIVFDVAKLRRRVQVHNLHADGLTNEQIGHQLEMSTDQVRTVLSQPKPKLHDPPSYWWSDNAACAGMDTEVFFPKSRGRGTVALKLKAMQICRGCPVRQRCLESATAHYEQNGVWGGKDFSQFRYGYNNQTGEVEVWLRGSDGPVTQVS